MGKAEIQIDIEDELLQFSINVGLFDVEIDNGQIKRLNSTEKFNEAMKSVIKSYEKEKTVD